MSAAQQAVAYWEMSCRGWGPKLYGVFPGGRLEEYVVSHPLTAAESTQLCVQRDVARAYARLHSLQLPLRKYGLQTVVRESKESADNKREESVRVLLAIEDPSGTAEDFVAIFQATGWARELRWVSELFEKHSCTTTVTHGDTNYLNVLVKDFESDCRVVLIGYETVSYSHRGFDIGGHLNERMYCYNQPRSQLDGFAAPTREEQRLFCEAYLEEMRDLGEVQSEGVDTVEHLLLEASIGQLYDLLHTNLMCTVFDEVEVDPLFLSGLVHMMEMYRQLKCEFVENPSGIRPSDVVVERIFGGMSLW